MGINWCFTIYPFIREKIFKNDFACSWIKNKIGNNNTLYVWGCGKDGKLCGDFLHRAGVKISGYIDNNKTNKIFCEESVFLPEEIITKEGTIIVASRDYESVISLQIINMQWHSSVYIFSHILSDLILDLFTRYESNFINKDILQSTLFYHVTHKSWNEVEYVTKSNGYGYATDNILRHAIKVAKKNIKKENVMYSNLLDKDLLIFLLLIKSLEGKVHLIDFGGAMGNICFQYKDIIPCERWHIVEQKHFVEYGMTHFPQLEFHSDIFSCLNSDYQINSVLFLSSLQYVSNPYELLNIIVHRKIPYILIERVPFGAINEDVIAIQNTPIAYGYDAKYPTWIFNKNKMIKFFKDNGYKIFMRQECKAIYPVRGGGINMVKIEGFIMQFED